MPKKIIGLFALMLFATLTLGNALSASATSPDPALQGGNAGVLYFTEETDGAIYLGDFSSTTRSTYWQQTDSYVDSVAVTASRVAWSSLNSTTSGQYSALRGKVLISNVGATAGQVTTVTIPDDPSIANAPQITSLAADYFAERFYVTTNEGKIYSFFSDGTDVQLVASSTSISSVWWGLWVDPYNSELLYCNTGGNLYKSTISGNTISAPSLLKSSFLSSCDGLGVDPVTRKIYGATYGQNTSFATYLPSSNTLSTVTFSPALVGGAPSSMFVSSSTSKFYFTTEERVYEANFDGTGVRDLYSGSHASRGFENLAVYYGATMANITTTGASEQANAANTIATATAIYSQNAVNNQNNQAAPASDNTATAPQLATTGMSSDLKVFLVGLAALLLALGTNLMLLKKHSRD